MENPLETQFRDKPEYLQPAKPTMIGGEPEILNWKASAFVWDKNNTPISKLGYSQSEVLALAYFASVRKQVVGRDFSYLASFDGRHRSGKSLTATTIGYLWDDTFWDYYESRVLNEPKEFMDAIERVAKLKIKGAVFQVDEAGVSLSSTDWYERWMKTITKTIQMFGYLCPIVLFCAPIRDFVDARIRKMMHAYYKVDRYTNDFTHITPYNLKYSTVYNKWFYKKPLIRIAGQKISLNKIKLSKPPDFIIDRYEAIASRNKSLMLQSFLSDMKRDEVKAQKQEVDIDRTVDYIMKNYQLFLNRKSRPNEISLDSNRIEYSFKVPNRLAKYIKDEVERKIRDNQKKMAEEIVGGNVNGANVAGKTKP